MRGQTNGSNNSDLIEMNRSAVVKILQREEMCSRVTLARKTGLTQAAITKIVATLIDMGIVYEEGFIRGIGNRRSIGIKLNADRHQVIGVKLARQMFSVGVFDISGKLYTKTDTTYSLEEDYKTVISKMKKQICDMLDTYGNIVAIGLAVPGPYLRDDGRIAVVTRMPTWRDVNFKHEFSERYFNRPVFIEHDANAGALAEWWFGRHGRDLHALTYLLVGEGVGSGVIENGNLLLGGQGTAGEIGHASIDLNGPRCLCGNYGCLESYCSAQAMAKIARERVPECLPKQDMESGEVCGVIFEAARNGNSKALQIVEEVARYIGCGCAMLITAYNPEVIVIGDSMIYQGGDLLMPIIQEAVKQRSIYELYSEVKIEVSALKVDSILYGAAAVATDKVLQLPSMF